MNNSNPDDLEGRYLKGKLSGSELENFKKMLADDPDLAHKVDLRRTEMAASELLIAEQTRRLFEDLRKTRPSGNAFFRSWPIWAIIAGVLLIATIGFIYRKTTPRDTPGEKPMPQAETSNPTSTPLPGPPPTPAVAESEKPMKNSKPLTDYFALARQRLPAPQMSGLRQSMPNSDLSILQQAQLAYASGRYRQTLDLLSQTDSLQQQSAIFLRAHTLFQMHRFDGAGKQFMQLIALKSLQFRYQSEWGLLMCRLADYTNREKETRQQLNEILSNPDHPYFEQAQKLKQRLDK